MVSHSKANILFGFQSYTVRIAGLVSKLFSNGGWICEFVVRVSSPSSSSRCIIS